MEKRFSRDPDKSDLCSSFKGPPEARGGQVSEYCQSATSASNNPSRAERDMWGNVMVNGGNELDLGGEISAGACGGLDYDEEMTPVCLESNHITHHGEQLLRAHQERMKGNSSSSDEEFVRISPERDPYERVKELRQLLKESEAKRMQKQEEFVEAQRELDHKNMEIQELRLSLDDSRVRSRTSERNLHEATKELEAMKRELERKSAQLQDARRDLARSQQHVLEYASAFSGLLSRARNAEEQLSSSRTVMEGMRTTLYEMQLDLERNNTPDRPSQRAAVSRETSRPTGPQIQQSVRFLAPRPGYGRLEADGPCPVEEGDTPVMLLTPAIICHPSDEQEQVVE